MKLFVWDQDVLCDYTCGIVVVIAHDLSAAFDQIKAECSYAPDLGKPDTVVDLGRKSIEPRAWVVWGGG